MQNQKAIFLHLRIRITQNTNLSSSECHHVFLVSLPRWFSAFSSFEEDTGNLWLDCYGARIKWSSKFKICLFPPSWQIVCRFRTAVSLYFTTYQEKISLLVVVNKNLETSRQIKNKFWMRKIHSNTMKCLPRGLGFKCCKWAGDK